MHYTTFGRVTGLRISEYALGTGSFGTAFGIGATPEESKTIFERFAEAGGTFIDTADNYQASESEEILGDLLGADRDHFVVATKYSRGPGHEPHLAAVGNSRRTMVRSVEGSLRRLKTDRIDLLWAHYDDTVTPIEEIVRAFDDLVAAGKILYGALSNFPAWRVARAQTIAELRGLSPIAGIQVEHSLVERTAERELLPMVEALGLGAVLYSPLGGGFLTGKHRHGGKVREIVSYRDEGGGRDGILDAVVEVGEELGASPAQVAVAWQRHLDARSTTALVTVIGPRTLTQLDNYLAALDVKLSDEQMQRLSKASAIAYGVPHDGIAGPPDLGDSARLSPRVVPVA
jgi:aryl-alcohol dehydrogenase-like predicted oxidoreductase